jgi:hypothetical protein
MFSKNKKPIPENQLALEKEQERYFKALAKLRKEQEATHGTMIDDRKLDLTYEHYRRIVEISQKQKTKKRKNSQK